MFGAAQRTRGGPHVCGEAHHSTSEGSNGTSRATTAEAVGAGSDLQERVSGTRGVDAKLALGAAGIRRRLRRDLRIGDVVQHHRSALPRPTRHLRARAPCGRRQRGRVRPVAHGHLLRGLHPLHDGCPPRSLPHPGPARREAGGDRVHRRQAAAHPPPCRPRRHVHPCRTARPRHRRPGRRRRPQRQKRAHRRCPPRVPRRTARLPCAPVRRVPKGDAPAEPLRAPSAPGRRVLQPEGHRLPRLHRPVGRTGRLGEREAVLRRRQVSGCPTATRASASAVQPTATPAAAATSTACTSSSPHRPCRRRELCLCWLRGILVLAEDAA